MSKQIKAKSRKWTYEAILADAKKYTSRSEWRKGSHGYTMAHRNGWLEDACAHMVINWQPKWDKKTVFADALKYKSRSHWEKKSGSAVASAKRNGWYEEATQHMLMLIERWTKKAVIADAKKYQTRGEWFAKSKSYSAARYNNWIEEATAHMQTTVSFGELIIYTDLLEHDINFTHQMRFEGLRNINKLPYDFFLHDFNLAVEYNGIQHERGWQGNDEDARNIKKRDEIKYKYAIANNINYIAISKVDREDIIYELHEFIKKLVPEYEFRKRKLTNHDTSILKNIGIYTKEKIIISASKYKTITEWRTKEAGAYNKALKMRWIDDVTSHMTRLRMKNGYWSKEAVIHSARNYQSQTEWKKDFGGAWGKAIKMGWINEACAHMNFMDESKIKPQGYWTKFKVIESAKKYKTQAEWNKAEASAVRTASKKGWIEEATAHMSPYRPKHSS